MAQDDEHVGINEDQTHNTSKQTDLPLIVISREELRSLIQIEVKSAVEATQREEMGSMFRNLVEETICDVSATGYSATTECINNSFFSTVENGTTKMIHRGALDEMLNQSFNY